MKETTITLTVTGEGNVLLNGDRIGTIGESEDAYRPLEGRMTVHALPDVPKRFGVGDAPDTYAIERAAVAVAAWHMLKIETH